MTRYNTNNQTETIDIKEVYNQCALSNPKENDIDIIPISKIRDTKTRKDTSFSSPKTERKGTNFSSQNQLQKKQNNIIEKLKIMKTKSPKAPQTFI